MHVYDPKHHDRIGWSDIPPDTECDPLPDWWEWGATFFVYATVGVLIVSGTLAALFG